MLLLLFVTYILSNTIRIGIVRLYRLMDKCFSPRCTKYRCYSPVVSRKDICKITDEVDAVDQDLIRIWSGAVEIVR
jgi:hypothetical protein